MGVVNWGGKVGAPNVSAKRKGQPKIESISKNSGYRGPIDKTGGALSPKIITFTKRKKKSEDGSPRFDIVVQTPTGHRGARLESGFKAVPKKQCH